MLEYASEEMRVPRDLAGVCVCVCVCVCGVYDVFVHSYIRLWCVYLHVCIHTRVHVSLLSL